MLDSKLKRNKGRIEEERDFNWFHFKLLNNFSGSVDRESNQIGINQGTVYIHRMEEEGDFNQCQCNVSQFTSFEYKLNQDVEMVHLLLYLTF